MNIYSCYTPSHKKLYWKYFQSSVCFDTSVASFVLPECGNGTYKNELWTMATKSKLEAILEIIDSNIDDIFIFSDVDIQFFGPLTDLITDSIRHCDLVTQNDPSLKYDQMYCTGFMAIRNKPRVRALFQATLDLMNQDSNLDDQDAFNIVARDTTNVKIGLFDQNVVWSHRKMWKPGDELEVPEEILVHHANWTHTLNDKEIQLEEVANLMNQRLGADHLQKRTANYRDRSMT